MKRRPIAQTKRDAWCVEVEIKNCTSSEYVRTLLISKHALLKEWTPFH